MSFSGSSSRKLPARTSSTSWHSLGEALWTDTARGRLLSAAIATIFVPLPRRVGPTDLLEITAGDLGGELVGNDFAGALFLFDPGCGGQGDPHGAAIHVEADIHRVGVAGGDGDNVALPAAVQGFSDRKSVV